MIFILPVLQPSELIRSPSGQDQTGVLAAKNHQDVPLLLGQSFLTTTSWVPIIYFWLENQCRKQCVTWSNCNPLSPSRFFVSHGFYTDMNSNPGLLLRSNHPANFAHSLHFSTPFSKQKKAGYWHSPCVKILAELPAAN